MVLPAEAQKHKPKKPLNAYFKFRNQKIEQLKGVEDRKEQIAKMWQEIDPEVKTKMENEFHSELEQYKIDLEAWKNKYDIQPEDMKRKTKKKKNDDTDEEEKKPIKTKGNKEPKKEEEKKKEEKDNKKGKSVEPEKGKSKPKVEKKKGK